MGADKKPRRGVSEFQELYAPLLYRYACGRGLSRGDVRDQCLEVVARKTGDFEYDEAKGGFKSRLYRIAGGKVNDLPQKRRERIAAGPNRNRGVFS